jgi:hypothetical protein
MQFEKEKGMSVISLFSVNIESLISFAIFVLSKPIFMANLSDHLILYDAECPMCRSYTRAFVKTGMLDNNGRAAYQQEQAVQACPMVNLQRAVNEIALVNRQTGEVTYGIESSACRA